MKFCNSCSKEKKEDDFGIRRASPDGLAAKCKACQSSYDKARAMLPHRVKARKEYAQTDAGKKAGNKAKKAWESRNAIKKGASTIVGNAVRDGRLAKPESCESCGNTPSRLHGHHNDYAYPLNVRWLCPGCHTKWHKDNGLGLNGD